MKKTDTMKKSELNVEEMENVAGGTGPLGKVDYSMTTKVGRRSDPVVKLAIKKSGRIL